MNFDELAVRAVVTVEELAPLLGMSPRSVHRAMDRGEIPEWWCGRRRLVPVPALLRLLGADPPNEEGPGGEPGPEVLDRAATEGATPCRLHRPPARVR